MAGSTLSHRDSPQQQYARKLQRYLLYGILVLGAVISIFPFYWMFNTSLKPAHTIFKFPPDIIATSPSFASYIYVWNTMDVIRSLFNSVVVSVFSVLLNVFFSSWVGYALAKLEFPLKRVVFFTVLALMILPQQLLMIPLFLQVDRLGLLDTYAGIILPGAITPFTVFLLRQAFLTLPDEYVDAAIIDGANHFHILFQIAYPIARPLLLTAIVINFYWSWNAFLWPFLVIRSDELTTLPIALSRYHAFAEQRWDAIMAAATVVALPIFLLYLVIQKQFVESMTMTGLKG